MAISIYALAKKAGVNPQSLYMQARTLSAAGTPYLKAARTTCKECGHSAWMVDDATAEEYLRRRAARLSAK